MSELINTSNRCNDLRWKLLSTVSAATLAVVLGAPGSTASAQTQDRPTVWIELGGQLESLRGREETYAPPFVFTNLDAPLNSVSPTSAQQPPPRSFGGEGKLTFQPERSDWVFSAGVRYGRSNGKKTLHQQSQTQYTIKTFKYGKTYNGKHYHGHNTYTRAVFNHSDTDYSETHAILDFKAGKDVGLGIFGKTTSVLSGGIRIAQFEQHSDVVLRSQPAEHLVNHHTYYAHLSADRSFHGIGPSISWEGSSPFLGHADSAQVSFDWGASGAILFGRQKTRGSHQTIGRLFYPGTGFNNNELKSTHYQRTIPTDRSHSVVVPNVGGLVGMSVKYPNAKFSLGYRADFFFNAMDQGIDERHSASRGFYGPFAAVSIGLGG